MDGTGIAALTEPATVAGRPSAEAAPLALCVEGVSHAYGERRALIDVSLSAPRGGFVALLGLNGAGKTTLFSLITRLFDTRHGRISVQGFDVSRRPSAALAELGVVFQARTLDLDITVRDNLLYHAALHGMGGRRARSRVAAVLDDVGMADRARDKARQLSGGQMRRVEIARALVHQPSVLVLDEPTVGLDVASKATIVEQVRTLSRTRGVAVLWATHLLDEIEPGDHVVVLHQGRVLATGEMSAIIAAAGAADLRTAFRALTGATVAAPDAEEEGA
jgi:ABC-2 type transport system ATP-binding protein